MKRNLVLLLSSLLACSAATAQIRHPFVENGKVWTYYGGNSTGEYTWEEVFSLEGDTVIGSRQCMKLYVTRNSSHDPLDHLYKGALYEDDGKVFYIVSSSTTPALLYDFSSEPGTVVNIGPFELTVIKRAFVKYQGEYWTVVEWVPAEYDRQSYQWIEGVGLITGVGNLLGLYEGIGTWWVGGSCHLKTCKLNGQTIFDSSEYLKSAEIVTGIASPLLPSDEEMVNCQLSMVNCYDLQGRKLPGKPKRGIYIEGGQKKVMVK